MYCMYTDFLLFIFLLFQVTVSLITEFELSVNSIPFHEFPLTISSLVVNTCTAWFCSKDWSLPTRCNYALRMIGTINTGLFSIQHAPFSVRYEVNILEYSQQTAIPWNSQVRYLGLLLDPILLFMRHLTSIIHKAAGILYQLFLLLKRDSTLSISNKITLYKLSIRSVLTYADPVRSNTSTSNYRRLQILRSKCLRFIGNYPRHTPHPTSSYRPKRRTYPRLHLPFDR